MALSQSHESQKTGQASALTDTGGNPRSTPSEASHAICEAVTLGYMPSRGLEESLRKQAKH